ncbi:MAG: radical SAM protein [Deltaproteobacteria bacterium]|nr:radical SAM protein [Deltaproteobacteria bacterium]
MNETTSENAAPTTTVAFATLGCKANQYDSSYLEAQLQARRFRLVDFKEKADIYIINTCTVTDGADLDSRNLIRRANRRNPEAFKIVTGCYAQTKPGEVARIEGVDLVLGNDKKAKLLDYLEMGRPERPMIEVDNIFLQTELETFGMASYSRNTRAFVKIQDGCNQFCSFCIIPYARGQNRSISIPRVLEELRRLSEQGFCEAVLTGIHIGTYGHDQEPANSLYNLLKAIEETRPIHRVRVSSIDPEEVSDEMVELFAGAKVLCPHLHIPLQAGVFPFSPKRGTRAAKMLGQVPPQVKKAYAERLRELSEAKIRNFRRGFAGAEVEVLLEGTGDVCQNGDRSETVWTGFSENYLPVEVATESGFRGKLVRCRLELNTGGSLAGKSYPGRKEAAEGI